MKIFKKIFAKEKQKEIKKFFKKFGIHLLVLIVIIIIVAPISVAVYNSPPRKYKSSNVDFKSITYNNYDPRQFEVYNVTAVKSYNVLLDPHSHSTFSDGGLSPEDNIKWHILNGYNAMVLTDHNTVRGGLEAERIAKSKYADQIVVIPGIEWTNCRCHLGLIGVRQDVPLYKRPTDDQIRHVIELVHAQGGLVVLNHYPWSSWVGLDQPSLDTWLNLGIDFIEVVNDRTLDLTGIKFAEKHNLKYLTGSDFHMGSDAATWTVFSITRNNISNNNSSTIPPIYPSNQPINARYLTMENILSSLKDKNNNLSFIFDATGSHHRVDKVNQISSLYQFLSPWIYLGEFFHSFFDLKKGMYSFVSGSCTEQYVVVHSKEIISLIGWILFLFTVFELTYYFIYKLIGCLCNKRKRRNNSLKANNDIFDDEESIDYSTNNDNSKISIGNSLKGKDIEKYDNNNDNISKDYLENDIDDYNSSGSNSSHSKDQLLYNQNMMNSIDSGGSSGSSNSDIPFNNNNNNNNSDSPPTSSSFNSSNSISTTNHTQPIQYPVITTNKQSSNKKSKKRNKKNKNNSENFMENLNNINNFFSYPYLDEFNNMYRNNNDNNNNNNINDNQDLSVNNNKNNTDDHQ